MLAVTHSHGQDLAKKNCPKTSGPSYKIGFKSYQVGDPLSVILQIEVDKKYFNKESMIELARRLRSDYCKATLLSVTLYDNMKAARDPGNLFLLAESHGKTIRMRRFYILDRKTGEEGLEFSTELGKPTNQVPIHFKDGEPIL